MARYGTLKRNIRRNVRFWGDPDPMRDYGLESRAKLSKLLAVILAAAIAGGLLEVASGIIFRVPDLYSFDLGRTQALKKANIGADRDEVAAAVSAYMRHKADSLGIEARVDGSMTRLFTDGDARTMRLLRFSLDNIVVIGVTSLALALALYLMLLRWNRPRELVSGVTGGFIAFGAILAFFAAGIRFGGPVGLLWSGLIGVDFAAGDMLPELFHRGLFMSGLLAAAFVTLVIMLVLLSATRRLARTGHRY
jgi:hypothetical protein